MPSASDWIELVDHAVDAVWPDLSPYGVAWITAQVEVESGGDPRAESECGAIGLMQLMPDTADEVWCQDPWNPSQNLLGGITYLKKQYDQTKKLVPDHDDRLLWAFAAYNGGYGYVRKALDLARSEGKPEWWRWSKSNRFLASPECFVPGKGGKRKRPDHKQIREYVAKIQAAFKRNTR